MTDNQKKLFGVVVCNYGYVEIEAESADEAMYIVDTTVRTDEVSWYDDWSSVSAECIDDL